MATGQGYASSTSSSSTSCIYSDSADSSSSEEDGILEKYKRQERKYAASMANVYEEISEGQFKSE